MDKEARELGIFMAVLAIVMSAALYGTVFLAANSSTTYSGTITYGSVVDGQNTLIINNHALVCPLQGRSSELGINLKSSSASVIVGLRTGEQVSIQVDGFGDCLVVSP